MRSTVLARLAAVAALAVGPVLLPTAAHADGAPFKDTTAKGYLALCDSKGKPLTSGSVTAKPFADFAISSVAAPTGYGVQDQAKGTLYAYQPQKGLDPGYWSGTMLTASSFYNNQAHPMAQGTLLDYSLADFLSIYPARWDGLVQLRMFLGAPGKPTITTPYPATTIKVEGESWHVVDGGPPIACNVGEATSIEKAYRPAAFASASASAAAAAQAQSSATPTPGGSPSSAGSTGSGGGSSGTSPAASSSSSRGGTSWLWPTLGGVVGLLALVLVGVRLLGSRSRAVTS